MNVKNKTKTWLGAAAVLLLGLAGRASAAVGTPSYLNIDVTIVTNLSVAVDMAHSSTQTVTWNGATSLVAATTSTVTNDSAVNAGRWELTTTASSWDSTSGAAGWTIATAAGADQVKLQAVFGAQGQATGACSGATWGDSNVAPALTSATQTPYTATVLADTALGGNPAKPDNTSTNYMNAGSSRALCWKMTMPTSTSLIGTQVVPVVVTAF